MHSEAMPSWARDFLVAMMAVTALSETESCNRRDHKTMWSIWIIANLAEIQSVCRPFANKALLWRRDLRLDDPNVQASFLRSMADCHLRNQ
jgi:hypothetical protein